MKKITLFVAAVAVLASCNREDALTTQGGEGAANAANMNVKHYEQSELVNMITPMSNSFGFNGKASVTQVNYTYRGWAEPVQLDLRNSGIDGTSALADGAAYVNLSATAAWTVKDMVFVSWHARNEAAGPNSTAYNINAPGFLVGGAITAYKQVGIGQYEFMDRVDFFDADYHELYGAVNAGAGNYEIMMAGQRAQSTSGYVLNKHKGAVITRIDYDYINDEFWEASFRELPLTGVSANDVVGAARRFYVTTGGATGLDIEGDIFEFDRNLKNINKMVALDAGYGGRSIAIDNKTRTSPGPQDEIDDLYVLSTDGTVATNVWHENITYTPLTESTNFGTAGSNISSLTSPFVHNTAARADLTIASSDDNPFTDNAFNIPANDPDPIAITVARTFVTLHNNNGDPSLYNLVDNGGAMTIIPNVGNAMSTEYDAGLDVLYVAMGGDANGNAMAIKVLALDKFATQSPLVNMYDIVGEFADPSLGAKTLSGNYFPIGGTMTPAITDVKEITVFGSRNIALAAGNQGVFFIQRDKY